MNDDSVACVAQIKKEIMKFDFNMRCFWSLRHEKGEYRDFVIGIGTGTGKHPHYNLPGCQDCMTISWHVIMTPQCTYLVHVTLIRPIPLSCINDIYIPFVFIFCYSITNLHNAFETPRKYVRSLFYTVSLFIIIICLVLKWNYESLV